MTVKSIQKYNKKGIFTVQQLSYLYRPRKNRRNKKADLFIKHSLELQAMAIREQKIYIQELPNITKNAIDIYSNPE
jgi:hypothetical protein